MTRTKKELDHDIEAFLQDDAATTKPDSAAKEDESKDWYATTYCNRAHRLRDGKPIGHQCYVIPPEALRAERDGDNERAISLIETARRMGRMPVHNGVRISSLTATKRAK